MLLIDAGTFAVMALVAITLPILKRSKPPAQAPLSERLGLHQLWDMKIVRYTTLLSLVFFFSYGPLEAAMPVYSDAILQTDARGYGFLWSALAVGALIGTLSSPTLSQQGTTRPSIWGTVNLAHRRIAAWFSRWWHPAGICPCNQRDCFLCARLHPCRFGWTFFTSIPRHVSSACSVN